MQIEISNSWQVWKQNNTFVIFVLFIAVLRTFFRPFFKIHFPIFFFILFFLLYYYQYGYVAYQVVDIQCKFLPGTKLLHQNEGQLIYEYQISYLIKTFHHKVFKRSRQFSVCIFFMLDRFKTSVKSNRKISFKNHCC